MEWNLIETVDPHSIPKRVVEFPLEGNPFLCTCELMPYKNWVKERKLSKIIKDWASKYQCSKPHQWEGKTLDMFRPKITDCQEFNAYVITAIVLCFLMVIIVIATNIYSRRRKQNILKKFQYTHDSSEKRKLLSSSQLTIKNLFHYYGPPEGGPLFDTHLNFVTAFLRDSFFFIELILCLFL